MKETMNERFEERFNIFRECNPPFCHNMTWSGDINELKSFIQSEIDLERKRIVEMIREYAEPYDGSKWLNEVNAQKIINLITNK